MYEKLPEKLKQCGRFCLWKYEMRKGRQTKVPYQISGAKADPGDRDTFADFLPALSAYQKGGYSGIGIGIFDDLCAVDIDHCIEDGKLSAMAENVVCLMDSYTETSPSGTGVRIIFKAPGISYGKDEYYINNHKMKDSRKELESALARIARLDTLAQRLYEDNVDGKILDERFEKLSAIYEAEQRQLQERTAEMQEFIDRAKEQHLNVDSFLAQIRKYTDITELDAEIVRAFVDRIEAFQPEKIPGTRTKQQTIRIYWNFIGAVDIPQENEKSA